MRKFIVALSLAAATPAFAQAGPQPQAALAPPAAGIEAAAPAVDAAFRAWAARADTPGLVWGVVRDGRLVHFGGQGIQDVENNRPVGPETLFRIASMSKVFTALAILKLRDEGRLQLDALAETYVPELRNWRYPTSDSPRIRVRDLLAHTGGLVTDNPWGDRQQPLSEEEFTRMLSEGVPLSRAAGTAYEYSNFGYALLGRIIGNVSGRPYKDYIEQEILRPLGMGSTGYEIAESPLERRAIGYRREGNGWRREPDMAHGAFGAMGGIQTSATDYARWVAFLLSAWPPRDGAEEGPVRRASVRELAEGLNHPQLADRPGPAECAQAAVYGMGLRVAADCDLGLSLAHGGGYPGYGSYMLLLPGRGVGIFAFANGTYQAPVVPVWAAAAALEEAGLIPARTLAVSELLAAAYRGTGDIYRAGGVEQAGPLLAMNFLLDRSAEEWRRDLASLRLVIGECETGVPIQPTGLLSGRFTWRCQRGSLQGELLLAPTATPSIQELSFTVVPLQ